MFGKLYLDGEIGFCICSDYLLNGGANFFKCTAVKA
jgi:hypothetical protein